MKKNKIRIIGQAADIDVGPDVRWCKKCNALQPMRTKGMNSLICSVCDTAHVPSDESSPEGK